MKKLTTYEQCSTVLADFKKNRARCRVNKLLMRDEVTALIEAGKLYYEQIGDTLWFFSDEDSFYSSQVYVPAGAPIEIRKQDKDVLVELMGNETRYDGQMEQALLAAGFEKYSKYLELTCRIADVIEPIKKQLHAQRELWGAQGFTCRKAARTDIAEVRDLWNTARNGEDYALTAFSEAELDEMERYGRCIVICDPKGEICAACLYLKKGSICYGYISATKVLGLGGWAYYEKFLSAYEEGCTKDLSWVRENNAKSRGMSRHVKTFSGKFYWQFVCRAEC